MIVYAIIVTFNGEKWIIKCLESLIKSSQPVKIIVIDNLSTDDTIKLITKNFPEVLILNSEKNLGFGKANNVGLKYALSKKADYVLLLNQDAWIDSNTISGLIDIHQTNTNYGIISPIHLTGAGTAVDYNFSLGCNSYDCPGFLSDLYTNRLKSIYSLKFVMAAIWLIPSEVLQNVGLFDPIFPHYGEDVDYAHRTLKHNYKIGICPTFKAYHDRENRPPSKKRERQMKKLGYLCILKNINKSLAGSLFDFLFQWIKNIIKSILNFRFTESLLFLYDGVRLITILPKIISHRKACIKNYAFVD